jgi:hypothetical protein
MNQGPGYCLMKKPAFENHQKSHATVPLIKFVGYSSLDNERKKRQTKIYRVNLPTSSPKGYHSIKKNELTDNLTRKLAF